MRLDFGGYFDGKRCFRVIDTGEVFESVDMVDVDCSLRIEEGGGFVEVDGVLMITGERTARIERLPSYATSCEDPVGTGSNSDGADHTPRSEYETTHDPRDIGGFPV